MHLNAKLCAMLMLALTSLVDVANGIVEILRYCTPIIHAAYSRMVKILFGPISILIGVPGATV